MVFGRRGRDGHSTFGTCLLGPASKLSQALRGMGKSLPKQKERQNPLPLVSTDGDNSGDLVATTSEWLLGNTKCGGEGKATMYLLLRVLYRILRLVSLSTSTSGNNRNQRLVAAAVSESPTIPSVSQSRYQWSMEPGPKTITTRLSMPCG